MRRSECDNHTDIGESLVYHSSNIDPPPALPRSDANTALDVLAENLSVYKVTAGTGCGRWVSSCLQAVSAVLALSAGNRSVVVRGNVSRILDSVIVRSATSAAVPAVTSASWPGWEPRGSWAAPRICRSSWWWRAARC